MQATLDQQRQELRKLLRFQTDHLLKSWKSRFGNFLETGYWTRDPKRRKVRKFPSRAERPDLYELADDRDKYWITNCAKARQIMESNLHLGEPIRDCLVDPHTVWVICSYDEDLARELVFDRITYSIEFLPKPVRLRYKIRVRPSENRIDFVTRDGHDWNSSIHAAEQGTMSVRQRTPSGVLLDEFGLMVDAEEMYATALAQVQADDDRGPRLVGKLRMNGTIWPDTEQLELLGDEYNQARELAMETGFAADKEKAA
jgi:hypothetical protein